MKKDSIQVRIESIEWIRKRVDELLKVLQSSNFLFQNIDRKGDAVNMLQENLVEEKYNRILTKLHSTLGFGRSHHLPGFESHMDSKFEEYAKEIIDATTEGNIKYITMGLEMTIKLLDAYLKDLHNLNKLLDEF